MKIFLSFLLLFFCFNAAWTFILPLQRIQKNIVNMTMEAIKRNFQTFTFQKGNITDDMMLELQGEKKVDFWLMGLLEGFKESLLYSLPFLGVPKIDPLQFKDVRANINDVMVSAKVLMRNITIRGLSNFTVNDLVFDMDKMKLRFEVMLPKAITKSQYQLQGKTKYFQFNTGGTVHLVSQGVRVHGIGNLARKGSGLSLEGFRIKLHMPKNQLDIGSKFGLNFLDSGLNWVVRRLLGTWLTFYKQKLSSMISDQIYNAASKGLAGVPLYLFG